MQGLVRHQFDIHINTRIGRFEILGHVANVIFAIGCLRHKQCIQRNFGMCGTGNGKDAENSPF